MTETLIVLATFLLALVRIPLAYCGFPNAELTALEVLFNTTHGTNWIWDSDAGGIPWNFNQTDTNPCIDLWQGISCLPESCAMETNCTIVSIILPAHNLNGSLPNIWSSLPTLKVLNLSYNLLHGPLPPSLNSLSMLDKLILHENNFTDEIPFNEDQQWFRLSYVQLDRNQFRGVLPDEISKLTNLKVLSLSHNELSGPIPSSWGYLQGLEELDLSNQIDRVLPRRLLRGPIPNFCGNWTRLRSFRLANNHFSGMLPSELSALTKLVSLNFDDNFLEGEIPSFFKNFQSLKLLSMRYNRFYGTLPAVLGNLSSLESLRLQSNFLYGSLPTDFGLGNASRLIYLNLHQNSFEGGIPASWPPNLPHLQYLHLSYNQLSGPIPSTVSAWQALKDLVLNANHFHGSFPVSLTTISSLEILYVDVNDFSGGLPDTFGGLPNLIDLFTGFNPFLSGPIPPSLCECSLLRTLNMPTSSHTGTVPKCLGDDLPDLKAIDLFDNFLTGTIPLSIYQSTNLYVLQMSSNYLNGTLAFSVQSIGHYTQLLLENNLFTGNLSCFEIGTHSTLYTLLLSHNKLTGTIPNFRQMVYLEELLLADNRFTGSLTNLSYLPYLVDLDFSNNQLQGCVPWYSFGNQLSLLNVSNNQFSCMLPSSTPPALHRLVSLDVSVNAFHGPIRGFFSNMSEIKLLFLAVNQFTGSLNTLIPTLSSKLFFVDVSRNLFTGSLPASIFTIPSLHTFVSIVNCLSSMLPVSICSSNQSVSSYNHNQGYNDYIIERNLTTLVLDGMGSNSKCKNNKLNPLFALFTSKPNTVDSARQQQAVFNCLFTDLPKLQVLHLSGIGLSASLPNHLQRLPASLQILSVSNNALTGTIPMAFFNNSYWTNLDLSFNALSGTLQNLAAQTNNDTRRRNHTTSDYTLEPNAAIDDSSRETTVELNIDFALNRLSGYIPASYYDVPKINILTGNIFDCPATWNKLVLTYELPENDPRAKSYSCASRYVDITLYIWLSTVGLVAVVVCGVIVRFWYISKQINNNNSSSSTVASNTRKQQANNKQGNFDHDNNNYLSRRAFWKHKSVDICYCCFRQLYHVLRFIVRLPQQVFTGIITFFMVETTFTFSSFMYRTDKSSYNEDSLSNSGSQKYPVVFDCFLRSLRICIVHYLYIVVITLCVLSPTYSILKVLPRIQTWLVDTFTDKGSNDAAQSNIFSNSTSFESISSSYNNSFSSTFYYSNTTTDDSDDDSSSFVSVVDNARLNFGTYEFQYGWTVSALFMQGSAPTIVCIVIFSKILYLIMRTKVQLMDIRAMYVLHSSSSSSDCSSGEGGGAAGGQGIVNNQLPTKAEEDAVPDVVSETNTKPFSGTSSSSTDTTDDTTNITASSSKSLLRSTLLYLSSIGWKLWLFRLFCICIIVLTNGVYVYYSEQTISPSKSYALSLAMSVAKVTSNVFFMHYFDASLFAVDPHQQTDAKTTNNKKKMSKTINDDGTNLGEITTATNTTHVGNSEAYYNTDSEEEEISQQNQQQQKKPQQENKWSRLSVTFSLITILCFNNVLVPYLAEAFISVNCFYFATLAEPPVVSSTIPLEHCYLLVAPQVVLSDGGYSPLTQDYVTFCKRQEREISYQPSFQYSYTCSSSLMQTFAAAFILRYLWTGVLKYIVNAVTSMVYLYTHRQDYSQKKTKKKTKKKTSTTGNEGPKKRGEQKEFIDDGHQDEEQEDENGKEGNEKPIPPQKASSTEKSVKTGGSQQQSFICSSLVFRLFHKLSAKWIPKHIKMLFLLRQIQTMLHEVQEKQEEVTTTYVSNDYFSDPSFLETINLSNEAEISDINNIKTENQQQMFRLSVVLFSLQKVESLWRLSPGFNHRTFVAPLVSDWFFFLTFGILYPPLILIVWFSMMMHVLNHVYWLKRWYSLTAIIQQQLATLKCRYYTTTTTPSSRCVSGAFFRSSTSSWGWRNRSSSSSTNTFVGINSSNPISRSSRSNSSVVNKDETTHATTMTMIGYEDVYCYDDGKKSRPSLVVTTHNPLLPINNYNNYYNNHNNHHSSPQEDTTHLFNNRPVSINARRRNFSQSSSRSSTSTSRSRSRTTSSWTLIKEEDETQQMILLCDTKWHNLYHTLLRPSLEQELSDSLLALHLPLPYIAGMVAVFWSFSLADTVGSDVNNNSNSNNSNNNSSTTANTKLILLVMVLVIMPLIPVLQYLCFVRYRWIWQQQQQQRCCCWIYDVFASVFSKNHQNQQDNNGDKQESKEDNNFSNRGDITTCISSSTHDNSNINHQNISNLVINNNRRIISSSNNGDIMHHHNNMNDVVNHPPYHHQYYCDDVENNVELVSSAAVSQ